jgi:hypothetical protein
MSSPGQDDVCWDAVDFVVFVVVLGMVDVAFGDSAVDPSLLLSC